MPRARAGRGRIEASVVSLLVPARTVQQATPRTRIIIAELGTRSFDFHAGQSVFAGLAESTVRRRI